MRRFLRLADDAPRGTRADAQKAFQTSIAISAVRCTLMYLVFPFVLPAIGLAQGWGPAIGLVVGAVAVVSMYYSMRRFWRAEHPKRWWYAGLAGAVFVLLVVMAIQRHLRSHRVVALGRDVRVATPASLGVPYEAHGHGLPLPRTQRTSSPA